MKPTITIDKNRVATLSGDLTHKYRNDILSIFQRLQSQDITSVITVPVEIDLTCLQIMWSFYITGKAVGKAIVMEMKLAEADQLIIERSGFKTFIKINI